MRAVLSHYTPTWHQRVLGAARRVGFLACTKLREAASSFFPMRRCHTKFSMFWVVPPSAVTGILNGLDPGARALPAPANLDDLLAAKARAKLAFQHGHGLQVGRNALESLFAMNPRLYSSGLV
jgi:hypothetical protein